MIEPFKHIRKKVRDLKKVRKLHSKQKSFQSEQWQQSEQGGLAKRSYKDYDEYVNHQVAKLGKIRDGLIRNREEAIADFTERFRACEQLKDADTVLCLGARLGSEVQALLNLGHFAVGIDLNPGTDNQYVLTGDFHDIVFPDGSVSAVYTNVLDHVFDLEKTLAAVYRILKPDGLFIADVLLGFEEGLLPGAYEALHWPTIKFLLDEINRLCGLKLESTREVASAGKNQWTQAVMRKSA